MSATAFVLFWISSWAERNRVKEQGQGLPVLNISWCHDIPFEGRFWKMINDVDTASPVLMIVSYSIISSIYLWHIHAYPISYACLCPLQLVGSIPRYYCWLALVPRLFEVRNFELVNISRQWHSIRFWGQHSGYIPTHKRKNMPAPLVSPPYSS